MMMMMIMMMMIWNEVPFADMLIIIIYFLSHLCCAMQGLGVTPSMKRLFCCFDELRSNQLPQSASISTPEVVTAEKGGADDDAVDEVAGAAISVDLVRLHTHTHTHA